MGKAFQAEEGIGCVKISGTGESGDGGNEKLREDQCWTENTSGHEPGKGRGGGMGWGQNNPGLCRPGLVFGTYPNCASQVRAGARAAAFLMKSKAGGIREDLWRGRR